MVDIVSWMDGQSFVRPKSTRLQHHRVMMPPVPGRDRSIVPIIFCPALLVRLYDTFFLLLSTWMMAAATRPTDDRARTPPPPTSLAGWLGWLTARRRQPKRE